MAKTLYKSKNERKLCGVCGGVAEYLGVDVNIVRIAAIVSVFFGGLGRHRLYRGGVYAA